MENSEMIKKDLVEHYSQEGDPYINEVVENLSVDDYKNIAEEIGENLIAKKDREYYTKLTETFEEYHLVPKTTVWAVEKEDLHDLYSEYDKNIADTIESLTEENLKEIADLVKESGPESSEEWWNEVRECFEDRFLVNNPEPRL